MIGFKKITKKNPEALEIVSLTDSCLVRINPQEEGFFDEVINFKSDRESINAFIDAVKEVKAEKLEAFYKPRYDPAEMNGKIVFAQGYKPAVGHSYNWWSKTASQMPDVEGRRWKLATEYQYYAFLVWLINQLIKSGEPVTEILNSVVECSGEFGPHFDSVNSMKTEFKIKLTGTKRVCGVYDLANTVKIMSCTDKKAGGFWLGVGYSSTSCCIYGSLAQLYHFTDREYHWNYGVGMLVL